MSVTTNTAQHSARTVARVPHVAICIATYRRPDGLVRLLDSLAALRFKADLAPRTTVVVIDNDAAAIEAPTMVLNALKRLPSPFVRHVEPTRGLAAVRNACLDRVPDDCDFIAFVDDDEWVEPGWLAALLDKQRSTGAPVVQGPVRPVFSVTPPRCLAGTGVYEVGPFEDGATLSYGATGNVLIERAALKRSGARFHPRFNLSGGEDIDFFDQLMRAGCRIVAAANAIAHEVVPPDRQTFGWALKRRFRTGHSLGLIARHHGGVAHRLIKAVARLSFGACVTVAGLITSRERVARGALDVAWGLGTLAAFTPFGVDQYSKR